MDDTKNTLALSKYTSNTGIQKIKKKAQKQKYVHRTINAINRKNRKQNKTKKNIKKDIIPINKSKKAIHSILYNKQHGGVLPTQASSQASSLSSSQASSLSSSQASSLSSSQTSYGSSSQTSYGSSSQTNVEAIRYKNKKVNFNTLSKAKKGKYDRMFKRNQKTLYGQILYLEYMYYKIMGYWRNVYKHIHKDKKTIYFKLIDIFSKNIPAFTLHMPNGIQVSDFSRLSTGTDKETYYDIVYSMSMMRRNERYNFLVGCDKEIASFVAKLASKAANTTNNGISSAFKATKALVQIASFVKTKTGLANIKDLYTELFNANKVLPQAEVSIKHHTDKAEFVCALFRFRRDQLKYNYYLDKFIVRLRRLFSSTEGQRIGLNGLHEFLYGSNQSMAMQYSINAITTNTPLTKLAKFKSKTDLTGGITTDNIAA